MTSASSEFFRVLKYNILPYWAKEGIDPAGGFYERVEPDGTKVGDLRRARVVNRQIYAFTTAFDMGWDGDAAALVGHAIDSLLNHHLDGSEVIPLFRPADQQRQRGFDLYDQAFALFGLAYATKLLPDSKLEPKALAILDSMRNDWANSDGGFCEHIPAKPPLKANPHMHLFEAAQAWMSVSDRKEWADLAYAMAELCISKFINPETGALNEFFDTDWSVLRSDESDLIEPGHQSEWAWLLARWAQKTGHATAMSSAKRLIAIAEGPGLDVNANKLVNSLNSDFQITDPLFRLWPQTERIKSLVFFASLATSAVEKEELEGRIDDAVSALLLYFEHPIAGCWWEHLDEQGQPVVEPTRASSLYHIMGAAKELADYWGLSLR